MCRALHIGLGGVGGPNQLYLGENPEPQMIPTSNLGQPGLTQGPTQFPFDDNLGPKKV